MTNRDDVTEAMQSIDALAASIPDTNLAIAVRRFFRYTAPEDIAGKTAQDLAREVTWFMAIAGTRAPAAPLVTAEQVGSQLRLILVNDDMPFLVDSVAGALAANGQVVDRIIHPQMVVRRDVDGRLMEVLDVDVDEPAAASAIAESWMLIDVNGQFDTAQRTALVTQLELVLCDVRASVTDWHAMRERALDLSADLRRSGPASLDPDEAVEGADLLDWLADNHFTFLGYRRYQLGDHDGLEALSVMPGTGLGLLRESTVPRTPTYAVLPPVARAKAKEPRLLVLTKANSRSRVHRTAYMDYVGVKTFDDAGNVTGEHRFLGLYTASAYADTVTAIPVLRQRLEQVMTALDLVSGSHAAKDVQAFVETYPRDELFMTHAWQLQEVAEAVLRLQDRRTTKVFLRGDDYGRFISVLVYLPRDRYTTEVRQRVQQYLTDCFSGVSSEFSAAVGEPILARLHYVIHLPSGADVPDVDIEVLERNVAQLTRSWSDEFAHEAEVVFGHSAAQVISEYASAFTDAYKERHDAVQACQDVRLLLGMQPGQISVRLTRDDQLRLQVLRVGSAMSLSKILPILQHLGAEVLEEHPYEISATTRPEAWLLDFVIEVPGLDAVDVHVAQRVQSAFVACWEQECESDRFNSLVLQAGLTWQQVVIVRAYARYMRQIGTSFSQEYIEHVCCSHADITADLVALFEAHLHPAHRDTVRAQQLESDIAAALDRVVSLDHDRILRTIFRLIQATVRTSAYRGQPHSPSALALKFKAQHLTELPAPRPWAEIWVYSPRVEGVHLRFGPVARGGLRWSDRREDFRTEILGLVKAQEVKNAVIVPVGAKGGFVPKQLPDPDGDRAAWLSAGRAAYTEFVSALLDVTDNLVDGSVVPAADVIRRDGDDPYLVVAADKGTATFSDLANSISARFGFWLGDAFASGGSAGYDHKAMGITARGAWESVKRHFRELGIDTQVSPFTVVGIGDMSGDVFGNGMLLSPHIQLVAAFDHRDIFFDPHPTPAAFAERARLFALERSSWADFAPEALGPGGAVYSRSAKSIQITGDMHEVLGIDANVDHLTPAELIHAILQAPVDLLFNGGIGTYVKASNESDADVGDKANDLIRVNGSQLRCLVVGEGGNLGLTQRGRIEAAALGVKVNTDAIDNSAGVDTSDHEVNIKVLLDAIVATGQLGMDERNRVLQEMTDEVAAAVLADNYDQNVVLGNARAGAVSLAGVHQRMMADLAARGELDRALEFLPDDVEMSVRREAGTGLTSPELSVLLAYSKISLADQLAESAIAADAWAHEPLTSYFPQRLQAAYPQQIQTHPLRDRIITTVLCNHLINIGGITFVFRAMEETGASAAEVVRAAVVADTVFAIGATWTAINALDNQVPVATQTRLHIEARRLLDRATRWFLQSRGATLNVAEEINRLRPIIEQVGPLVPGMLQGAEQRRLHVQEQELTERGAPPDLAVIVASGLDVYALLDIAELSRTTGQSVEQLAQLYFTVAERYEVDRLLLAISSLGRADRWGAMARQALRSDLYAAVAALTGLIAGDGGSHRSPNEQIADWEAAHSAGLGRAQSTLHEISTSSVVDLATLSVSLRVLRDLVAQGSATAGR